jgi:hypothetical protein
MTQDGMPFQLIGGDIWMTAEGNYLVRANLEVSYTIFGTSNTGSLIFFLDFFDINSDISIRLPESCKNAATMQMDDFDDLTSPVLPQPANIQANIESVTAQHDVVKNHFNGMSILVTFTVTNAKNVPSAALVNVFFEDGSSLQGYYSEFTDATGAFGAWVDFTPAYNQTRYDNLEIFLTLTFCVEILYRC